MVLIQLCIPVTGASYDIWLPKTVSIGQATDLVAGFFAGTAGEHIYQMKKQYYVVWKMAGFTI